MDDRIKDLAPPVKGKDRLVSDDEHPGLFVRISSKGSKTFLAQYTVGAQKRRVPLGTYPTLSLKQARKAAAVVMAEKALGRDPAADRKAKAVATKVKKAADDLTLAVLIERWERLHLNTRRRSYAAEAPRALRVAFARQLALPAASLDRRAVVAVLDQMTADDAPMMASRTAQYGRALYGWAMGRDLLASNPFERIKVAATVRRDRVLTDAELRAIWQAISRRPSSLNSIIKLLILTGQRRGEVAGLARSELSDDGATWTLPASRAKNNVAHQVPLSPAAQAIIRDAPRYQGQLVFPGRDGVFAGWHMAKERLDRASGVADWTLHDLRRSVATGMQKLGIRLEVVEACLNHTSGSRSGIVAVYQRYNFAAEKKAALEAWADRLVAIVEGREPASNVSDLDAHRAKVA